MSKMSESKSSSRSPSADKKNDKSSEKQLKSLTITRQIVIKTEEPDIPQITITKVQNLHKNGQQRSIANLQRICQQVKLKNLYSGLCKIFNKNRSLRMHVFNINRLVNILKNRQKRLIIQSWHKLMKINIQQGSKLNTIRLISKLSMLLLSKVKSNAFEAIRSFNQTKISKTLTEASQSNIKKVQQVFQRRLAQLRNQDFSQKFILLCRKFMQMNGDVFEANLQLELQPEVIRQIKRFQEVRKAQPLSLNNQTVLIILKNNLLTIKRVKKQLVQKNTLLPSQAGQLQKVGLYQQIQSQLQMADDQIRDSFNRCQRVDESELVRIVEKQLKIWNKNKQLPLYKSRLFISAIIVKLIKEGQKPLNQFIQILQQLYQSLQDVKQLQEFRRSLNSNQKASALLIDIINKFIKSMQVGMTPILERQFSQNQQTIMDEIKYIISQIKAFIAKINNPAQRNKIKKVFSSKRTKAPQQLKQFYQVVNQLIAFISNPLTKQKDGEGSKKLQISIKIMNKFNECLRQDNYKKWESFINSQINKQQYKGFLDILETLNDILNDKIKSQVDPKQKQIQNLKRNQQKIKQQNNNLKNKNNQLQKKIKNLQLQLKKSEDGKKDKLSPESEKKYTQLSEKYKALQLQIQNQRKLVLQKLENSVKISQQLNKKLQIKDQQLLKLQKQMKGLRQKSTQKQKKDEQIKKINDQVQKKFKQLQKAVQKLKQQLQQKSKLISQNDQKIKKYETIIKKYQLQIIKIKKEQTSQSDYRSLLTTNEELNRKIYQMKSKMQRVITQLQNKEAQIQNIRNALVNQQTKQASSEKSRTQYQALVRKIKVLDNTVQNLRHELDIKKKQLQQERAGKQSSKSSGISKKSKTPSGKNDKSPDSINLIKQLNKQLQKLKRSEVTLEQINRQLQKAHNKGQDVQNIISNVQIQNIQYRRTLNQKQRLVLDLQTYIEKLQSQQIILKKNIQILQKQNITKQQKIHNLQLSLKQREAISAKNQQNKRSYIRKLEDIIKQNEQNINQLNMQILVLKNRQAEAPSFITNQTENFDNLITELKQANQHITQLEMMILKNQKAFANQREHFKKEYQRYFSNEQNWDRERVKLTIVINSLQNQLLKSKIDIKQGWQQQKQKWLQDYNSWTQYKQKLQTQLKNTEIDRQKLIKQSVTLNEQLQKLLSHITLLQQQVLKLKQNGSSQTWQQEKQKLLLEVNIRLQNQKSRLLSQSVVQRQKYLREISNWESQRQKWINQNTLQKQRLATRVREFQRQKSVWDERQRNLSLQITRLVEQLNTQNKTIQQLRYHLTISSASNTNEITINNVVLLLKNITTNFTRINPKPTSTSDKTLQQVYQDLLKIKQTFFSQQNEMFMNFQNYVMRFIENDIQKYRYDLKVKIQELTALRDRLLDFINSEMEISKSHINYQYKYESTEKTTASKSLYETPAKIQKSTLLSAQLHEINQTTTRAQRLYGSEQVKKY